MTDSPPAEKAAASGSALPGLLELYTRMNAEETRDDLARELRHARETLDVIERAVAAEEWLKANECMILLKLKTDTLQARIVTLLRKP
jgi:DNA-binding XRE family transcriptional regulator